MIWFALVALFASLIGIYCYVRRIRALLFQIRLLDQTTISGGGVVTGYYKDSPRSILRALGGRIHSMRRISPACGKSAARRRSANRRFASGRGIFH